MDHNDIVIELPESESPHHSEIVDVQLTDRDVEAGENGYEARKGQEDKEYDSVPSTERGTPRQQYSGNSAPTIEEPISKLPPQFERKSTFKIIKENAKIRAYTLKDKYGECGALTFKSCLVVVCIIGVILIILGAVHWTEYGEIV